MSHVDAEILALRALEAGSLAAGDELHLTQCPQCQANLMRFAEIVTLARSGGVARALERPPDRVWQRITAELHADEEAASEDPVSRHRHPASRRGLARRGLGMSRPSVAARRRLAALGAVALLIGAGTAVGIQQLTQSQLAVVAQIPLRPLPQFPQWRAAAGVAVMARNAAGLQLKVTLHASPGRGFFEVWLLGRDGVSMISLGDLNSAQAGTFTLPPGVNLAFYSRIDISLQTFNGSTSHSKISVVRGSLPG